MKPKNKCCLCNIINGKRKYGVIDAPFMESESFIAVASIGAFIEGWTLIVPKQHQLSCAPNYSNLEFLEFTTSVKQRVEQVYGNVIMFEHGANKVGSLTGCGVDHAHFHIVPYESSLKDKLIKSHLEWNRYDPFILDKQYYDNDYLFYADEISKNKIEGIYSRPEKPESQFFRKLLSNELGLAKDYDYKKHLHLTKSLLSHQKLLSAA